MKQEYLALAIFAILIAALYGNTLSNGFVIDDIVQIQNNKYVHSLEYIPKAVTSCQWEYSNHGCAGRSINYRPPFFLSTILSWQISPSPWSYHLTNLFYFLIIVYLIFFLANLLTKNFLASLAAAVLFLIHPINTEVVAWASAAVELTLAIFVLLAVIFHIQYRRGRSIRNLIFVYVFYFLGILAKEPAALLPIIFVVMDILLLKMPVKKLLRIDEIKKYLFFAVPIGVYFLMRGLVIGIVFSTGGYGFWNFNFAERIYAFFTLFGKYMGKFFYPNPLLVFHAFQKSSNFASPVFLVSLIAVFLFFALIVILIRERKNLLAFSLVWFLVFLFPALVFLNAVGENVFSERYLFLPLIGFSLAVSGFFVYVSKSYGHFFAKQYPRIGLAILVFLIIAVSWWQVYHRNQEWKSEEVLSKKTLQDNPNAHSIRYNLARAYFRNGRLDEAKNEFEEMIRRGPEWRDITMAYKGLGDYYREKNDLDMALESYKKSVMTSYLAPRDYVTLNDLGVVYMQKGIFLNGFAAFCQAMRLLPDDKTTMENLDVSMSAIGEEYIKTGTLFQNISQQYVKSRDENISFKEKQCDEETCRYFFTFRQEAPEIMPPFLIAAATPKKVQIEIKNQSFNPQRSEIMLETDAKYEKENLTFLFPTCRGVYYEATAS